MDIQISLERGEYVRKRASLMRELKIPKLTEATNELGPTLAQIVFDECDEALKENFGLIPPLNGAGDELWVSPSDLLIGKVVLKPPLTQKHVQALTHQGILTIGKDIEMKFWNEMEMDKERALAEQRKRMLEDFEDKLKAKLRLVELRERAACEKEMQRMNEEFEVRLLEELDNLTIRLRDEFEELSRQQEERLREEFARTLKKEIKKTVENLTREFLAELERQKSILSRTFKLGLQKVYTQKEYEQRVQQAKYQDSINQLRHNLECKNIANMMYVLCMERRKCCDEKVDIEKYYETEIRLLHDSIQMKDQEIKELTDEKKKLIMEVNLRETCLLEIIRQYQKFINFALRAAPTQAEFLLSVEKMMIFELTDAVLKSRYRAMSSHYDILPWNDYSTKDPEMVELEIMDYHDCLNEINPPIPPDVELGPDDFLPAFNYGNKLYVREDFRNMVSQGIRITKSSTLWSKDVEMLMDTLQRSVSSTHSEKEEDEVTLTGIKPSKTHATASSIHFSVLQQGKASRTDIPKLSNLSGKADIRASIKPSRLDSLERVDFSKIGKVEHSPAILATRCSIELLIRKGSVKHSTSSRTDDQSSIDKPSEGRSENGEEQTKNLQEIQRHSVDEESSVTVLQRKATGEKEEDEAESKHITVDDSKMQHPHTSVGSLALETKDSIILRKTSMVKRSAEFNVTPKDSIEIRKDSFNDLKSRPSKLLTTKNSVEMMKESMMKIRDSGQCARKGSKFRTTGSSCIVNKETCSSKCLKTRDDSIEATDGLSLDYKTGGRKDSIKVSHIEVYNIDGSQEPSVVFNTTPVVYDTGSATFSTTLSEVYKPSHTYRAAKKKKFIPPPKDKFLSQRPELKILGDINAIEYLQNPDEFTVDRIKSFIALIKDNSQLIRTFTSCTR